MSTIGNVFGNQNKSFLEGLLRLGLNSFKAYAFEQITVDGTVKPLNPPTDAKYALCVLESKGTGIVARIADFPLSTLATGVGIPLVNQSSFDITDFANIDGFRITQEGANTTILNVQYYK